MAEDLFELQRRAIALHAAYQAGDLVEIRHLLDDPPGFPNSQQPYELGCAGTPLEYAFCWSPSSLIHALLDIGADVNFSVEDGFPALFTLLETDREDRYELLALLLDHGADIHQRGINDWTPLHYAVVQRDLKAIEILLARGADPCLKTRIDEGTTALEEAVRNGLDKIVEVLKNQAHV
ncbi:ankyrin repeat domain-containing protein [Sneathiella sp. HT1-7]|uniref:ankyrin repeat domain-containing protein n=1 Tax=Sneathiella sp. HT1-7 TaxID=2887192 RepID=UPI001D15609D|nr:ankyrin repeat domain-containing protein [Sneathiella sp. HT1-7]MCC3304032.1 ankyrin repeat domain-containing protein [Sneathiella sp. HT1-7]